MDGDAVASLEGLGAGRIDDMDAGVGDAALQPAVEHRAAHLAAPDEQERTLQSLRHDDVLPVAKAGALLLGPA
jgi:hypothetical protein